MLREGEEFEGEGYKSIEPATRPDVSLKAEKSGGQSRKRQKDLKKTAQTEPETTILLVDMENGKSEIISKEGLIEAGFRVIRDKNLKLFEGVELTPSIGFNKTIQG